MAPRHRRLRGSGSSRQTQHPLRSARPRSRSANRRPPDHPAPVPALTNGDGGSAPGPAPPAAAAPPLRADWLQWGSEGRELPTRCARLRASANDSGTCPSLLPGFSSAPWHCRAATGRPRMRPGSIAPSSPSVISRLGPLRRGPAPGPSFPPVPLRLPEGRADQPCPQGLRLPLGGRARTPMEEPLALHPVKLYVYDLSKGMARRLSPLMLGKSAAGARRHRLPGARVPPLTAAARLCRAGKGAEVAASCPGGCDPRPASFC